MITLIVAAGEPSKVPFYIAGGLLVIWALGLAAVGLTRPSFPGNERGARGVMAVSFVLMAVRDGDGRRDQRVPEVAATCGRRGRTVRTRRSRGRPNQTGFVQPDG